MISPHRTLGPLGLAALAFSVAPGPASAQHEQIASRGVQYLKSGMGTGAGEVALAALAMIKAEVPATDPALAKALSTIQSRFPGGVYTPERQGGTETYEAAVIILALSNLDPLTYKPQIESAARYVAGRQNPNGSWDYQYRSFGDTSISQHAVLGLWEAENAGVSISPSIWDRSAQFFLSTQSGAGGWTYHRDDGGGTDTVSMTAAGVGSLLICERQLAPYRAPTRAINPLLIPIDLDAERRKYTPEVPARRVTQGIQAGIAWLASNFTTANTTVIGHSPYYALYGIERIGALADQATLGRNDWFAEGQRFLAATQKASGGFEGQYGPGPSTSWAVLFLTKSTAKTLRKIQLRRLGAGTLIGGRGLPKDLSQVSVAGGRVVARPMDGAVEGMLAVLEDPRVEDASSALAGLIGRYRAEGSKALKPYQERFLKLLVDPDQGVRRVAAWALARTGDLSMTLPLIEALKDPDPGVVTEAGLGLQLLSRKIEGYGPSASAAPEQKERAIERWKAWYESVRPPTQGAEDGTASPKAATPTPRRSP